MKLYNYWRSGSSWRVRIALGLKGISYEYVPVNLVKDGGEQFKPEHRSRNPMGQVPVLEWTEDDGQVRQLAQSLAIIEYLDERFPDSGPPLLPKDRWLRAQARMLAEHINSGIQPFNNQATLKHVKSLVPDGDRPWAAHWIGRGLEALEQAVKPVAGHFCIGDTPTVVDCLLVPQLYSARRFEVALEAFPTLTRIESRCVILPAFQGAAPERQPDAPPSETR
jgi:maleylpyruvate isomerase